MAFQFCEYKLFFWSGNTDLEAAINWVVDHENDPDIDEMPLVCFLHSAGFFLFRLQVGLCVRVHVEGQFLLAWSFNFVIRDSSCIHNFVSRDSSCVRNMVIYMKYPSTSPRINSDFRLKMIGSEQPKRVRNQGSRCLHSFCIA